MHTSFSWQNNLAELLCENLKTVRKDTGSAEYRAVAEEAVEKSLVLLKNDNNVLPLKAGKNTIRLTSATAEGGPNFDYLRTEPADAQPEEPGSAPRPIITSFTCGKRCMMR